MYGNKGKGKVSIEPVGEYDIEMSKDKEDPTKYDKRKDKFYKKFKKDLGENIDMLVEFIESLLKQNSDKLKIEIKTGEIISMNTNGKGGMKMDLTHVHEKYKGLTGWEKLISEAQEREVLVIKPENLDRILEICEHNNVDATQIGKFNDTGDYHVLDQNTSIVYLPVDFITTEIPQMTIKANWKPSENKEPEIPVVEDVTGIVL